MSSSTPTKATAASDWDEYSAQQAVHSAKANARRQVRQASRQQDGGYSPSTVKSGAAREEVINRLEKKAEEATAVKKPELSEEQQRCNWERTEKEKQDRGAWGVKRVGADLRSDLFFII